MPARNLPLVSQRLLALDAIKLGRFVLDTDQPHQDYFDPPLDSSPAAIKSEQINLTERHRDDIDAQTNALLDPLAGASCLKHDHNLNTIATAQSTVHQLANSRDWFHTAIREEETRKWIEKAIMEGEKIYLIVGYEIVRDAWLNKAQSSLKKRTVNLQAPLSAALATIGVVLPLGVSADPRINQFMAESHFAGESHVAPGEQVSAVQDRKVKFKGFSSRDLDKAQLEKGSRWKMQRSFRGQEDGVNDIVEPWLSDDEGE